MSPSPPPTCAYNCCGKRPRTPRTGGIDQEASVDSHAESNDTSLESRGSDDSGRALAVVDHASSSTMSCDSSSCQQDTRRAVCDCGHGADDDRLDDAHPTSHEDGEPSAKVPRNSPTPKKESAVDGCMQQPMRLQKNQQRAQETSSAEERYHQQPEEKQHRENKRQQQTQTTTRSAAAATVMDPPPGEAPRRNLTYHTARSFQKKLPFAPRLADYMAAGGTLKYLPRPEWYTSNIANNNTTSIHGRRASESSAGLSEHHSEIFDMEQESPDEFHQVQHVLHQQLRQGHQEQPIVAGGAIGIENDEEMEAADVAVSAAPSMEVNFAAAHHQAAAADGVAVAPDDGLLPDGAFEALFHHQADNMNSDISRHTYHGNDSDEEPYPALQPDGLPPPTTFGRDFDPALHVTIRENAIEAALALLQNGAPVDVENGKGVTPLILASQKGNLLLVRELLVRGASPAKPALNGTTAVLQAAHFGHLEILEVLLDAGGSTLMEVANYNLTTPLMRAAQEGHKRVVVNLLERGALVNRRNRLEMTALMLSSQRGHAKVCQILIQHGAELDSMTAQNSTSLMLACKRGNVDVVRVLVTAGCELWVKDSRGRTARDIAQRRGTPKSSLVQLLDSNVQIEFMQQQQRRKRNYAMVMLWNLLQQERALIPMDICQTTLNGRRPVHHVTIHQISEELKLGHRNSCLDHRANLHSAFHRQNPPTVHYQQYPQMPYARPPTLPYHLSHSSTQALLRTMTLPAPLVEVIASYIPLPLLWERRVGMLTKRSILNADAAVNGSLDLIDEVLEEGGFVEACDYARVTPPTHFGSWCEWKAFSRLRCRQGTATLLPGDHHHERPIATLATVPPPQDPNQPSSVEVRRQVGFLQILANRSPILARVLAAPPFNMPMPLIEQLITSSDIQSLVRRMGSRGVHFESPVAMDLVMMSSRLCSWYSREREDSNLVKFKSQKLPLHHGQLPNLSAPLQPQQPVAMPLVEGAFSPPNGSSRNYNHQPTHDDRT